MLYKTILFFLLGFNMHAQEDTIPARFSIGAAYGFGHEFKNIDYSYSNSYIQCQLYYSLNPYGKWEYLLALQPEINFARHQLQNPYFVTPDEPDYEQKRAEYTKLKELREYILNVAFLVKYNADGVFGFYAMGNIGPMITDTDTERLPKGFAFCDVFAIGIMIDMGMVVIDLRPNVRHTSNLGLKEYNAGFNTYNIAMGVIFPLK